MPADDPTTRPSVGLLPGRHKRAEGGHPWIYSNEVRMDPAAKELAPGTLVTVRRADDSALGVAMFNPHSLVAARFLDRDAGRAIGRRFFARRLERALRLRDRLFELWPRDMAPGFYDTVVATCRIAGFEPRLDEQAAGNTVWGNIARGRGVALINTSIAAQLPPRITLVELAEALGR